MEKSPKTYMHIINPYTTFIPINGADIVIVALLSPLDKILTTYNSIEVGVEILSTQSDFPQVYII